MTVLEAIILGIVEGLTEFLPISSTAHLLLVGEFLQVSDPDFLKSFSVIIQLGAILAVVLVYWRDLVYSRGMLKKVAVAFLPTAVIGLVLYKFIKSYLLANEWVSVVALALGGIALIVFEKWQQARPAATSELTLKKSFWIGLAQALAVIPGVSRAGATIVGGMIQGVPRQEIVRFSFLLAIPTMLSASGLDFVENLGMFAGHNLVILGIGFGVSFAVALASIKWFLSYISKYDFTAFGWYRIGLAVVVALWLL